MQKTSFFFFITLLFSHCILFAQNTTNDGDWAKRYVALQRTPEADYMIRVGDIDNLGFGWDPNFDPFCGNNTPAHFYPWEPDANELAGLDRILLPSSFVLGGENPCGSDGYSTTENQDTKPKKIAMKLDILKGADIKSANLILFVDDFQAPHLCSQFRVYLNNTRFIAMERVLNNLDQTGPIGKIVNVKLPDYLLPLLKESQLNVLIDDSTSHAGDGFAIDFVKLLVNPKLSAMCKGDVSGVVMDRETGSPIANATIVLPEIGKVITNNEGVFAFKDVPTGLQIADVSASGYVSNVAQLDIMKDEATVTTLYLEKVRSLNFNGQMINVGSSLVLNNIQFDLAKYDLSALAKQELDKLVTFMNENPNIYIELSGHTSSDGTIAGNQLLSEQRVRSCRNYLISKGIEERKITAVGYGQEMPIAPNDTPANRAKNRRVEMKIVKMD
ncbi:MAG: OmpA family protein [Bacteroidia bacterium]